MEKTHAYTHLSFWGLQEEVFPTGCREVSHSSIDLHPSRGFQGQGSGRGLQPENHKHTLVMLEAVETHTPAQTYSMNRHSGFSLMLQLPLDYYRRINNESTVNKVFNPEAAQSKAAEDCGCTG